MRLFVDLGSHDPAGTNSGRIIKYEDSPEVNTQTTINGQYVMEIPEGASLVLTESDYIFPQAVGSVGGKAAQEMLVRYPMYDHILYNFFLETSDQDTIDLSASIPAPTALNTTPPLGGVGAPAFCRLKMGRTTGAGPAGMAPNRLEILSRTFARAGASNTYGCLISRTIDITSYNPTTPGTDEVMVWWKIARLETSHDVKTDYGTGEDSPSLNIIEETIQEPLGFSVWVSNDDGATWYNTPYLEPVDLVNIGTDIRIAFVNQGDESVFLLGYCILFPDLP